MKHCLVTGGAGFIGSHLCQALLSKGFQVTVIDNLSNGRRENLDSAVNFIEGDVRDAVLLRELFPSVQTCFHLAAIPAVGETGLSWADVNEINVTATINVLEATQACENINIVFASSCAVYGDTSSSILSESLRPDPISAYGVDKYSAELQAHVGRLQYQIPTVSLRLFNVYGPRQDPGSPYSGVVSKFLCCFKENKPVTIYGDGSQTRDFIFVDDVVRAFMLAAERTTLKHEIYNICTGAALSVTDLYQTFCALYAKEVGVNYQPKRYGDIEMACGDPQRSRDELEFKANYGIEEGLRTLI